MSQRGLIVFAQAASLALALALLTSCTEGGASQQEPQAKPASALMRGMDQDRAADWQDEPAPPQFESPPPEEFR